ncbi:MAG: NADH-quinone oxidoreductase subunit N [Bdellovibrionota bacterium]|nr:MAG: NADH-quinone oxidoreductase subunit N [Bdellovibrionota bacterium]
MSPQMLSDIALTSPMWIVTLGALLLLLGDAFTASGWSRSFVSAVILLLGIVATLLTQSGYWEGSTAFSGTIFVDRVSWFFFLLIQGGALLSVLVGMSRLSDERVEAVGEYYVLLLLATVGACMFVASAELITMFIGLETMSLALYCMCGAASSLRRSTESALKYFLLGSFSSAFLLFGISILYGLSASTFIPEIAEVLNRSTPVALAYIGFGLLLVGLAFKIAAVPFHFWAPDVYEGAPTPVTVYMACVVKAAAVGVCLRVLWTMFGGMLDGWSTAIWYIAFLSMTLGNLLALCQRGLKRMLAYSSIAHAGYITVAFLAPGAAYGGGPAILYYLVAYSLMTIGSFGVVLAVTSKRAGDPRADDISTFHGLGYSNPFLGILMALFLLSLAGIPPGMAGLLGKIYVFNAAMQSDYLGLVVIGVLNSAVSVYYYLRVIVAMYFIEPKEAPVQVGPLGFSMASILVLCALGILAIGVFPAALYDGLTQVAHAF